jgi:hypothetical protein
MNDADILANIFGTREFFRVPRPLLLKTLANSLRKNGELYLELFCADPQHTIFLGEPEGRLASMRLERVRRAYVAAEHFKDRQCTRAKDKSCPHKCGHHKPHQRTAACMKKASEKCGACE